MLYFMFFNLWLRALLVLQVLLLSSCASHSKRYSMLDHAPKLHFNASRIADALPHYEPLSKFGNRDYTIDGKRYYVMKSATGFLERGIASWYGARFHGHKTSNHERYNMFAMTAAHKTLPLPTYVRVTNLRNHRHVVVRVNDRGPFHGNRVIDLSYVAAKKLKLIGHGVAHVEISAITGYTHHQPRLSRKHFKHWLDGYYFQVAALSTYARAKNVRRQLQRYINKPITIKAFRLKKKKLYRIVVGPMVSLFEYNQIKHKIQLIKQAHL
jgi:rare lipoprotein A